MARFKSVSPEIEAQQYTGPESSDCPLPAATGVQWQAKAATAEKANYLPLFPFIFDVKGNQVWVDPGDWIIAEPDGRSYQKMKPDVFHRQFRQVG